MFKCDSCKCSSQSNEKPTKIATQRVKKYTEYKTTHDPKTRRSTKEAYETEGFEIANEMKFCKNCVGE